jgi:hypothetical protein
LSDAKRVNAGTVDNEIDYAVVDGTGNLVSASGRIPLYTRKKPLLGTAGRSVEEVSSGGRAYLILYETLLDSLRKPAGTIIVTQDTTLAQRALSNLALSYALFAACSLAILLIVGFFYSMRKKQGQES